MSAIVTALDKCNYKRVAAEGGGEQKELCTQWSCRSNKCAGWGEWVKTNMYRVNIAIQIKFGIEYVCVNLI